MPTFGVDGLLEPEQIGQVVQYVLQLSGQGHDAAMADGRRDGLCRQLRRLPRRGRHRRPRLQGAPNLTDAIWLYGGDEATLTETVTNARFGVMPSWAGRLSEAEIRAVAAYVHSWAAANNPPAIRPATGLPGALLRASALHGFLGRARTGRGPLREAAGGRDV